MARLNTKLESEGAEFLVLGQLLLHRIPAYKTYSNMPGYDIVATNPDTNRSARIQVKSRWRTGAPGFLIKNLDCEFVVVVRLNRGHKDGRGKVLPPEYFVLPIDAVRGAHQKGSWSKVYFRRIPEIDKYRDNYGVIVDFLAEPTKSRRQRNAE